MMHPSPNASRLRAYVEPYEFRLVLYLTGTIAGYRHLLSVLDRLAATETPDPITLRSGTDPLDHVGNTHLRFERVADATPSASMEHAVAIDISGNVAKQEVTFSCTAEGLGQFHSAITSLIENTSPEYHVHLDAHPAAPPSKLHAILFKKDAQWFTGVVVDELLLEEPLHEA